MKKTALNKKTAFALSLTMLLGISACEKETQFKRHEKTTVEGRLLSAADRSPIANGKVLLLSSYHDGTLNAIFYGRSFRIRNVLTSNAQGRFSHSFTHSDDTVYAIAAEADGYFPNRNSGGYAYPNWRATGLQRIKDGYINYFTQSRDEKDFQHEKGKVYYPEIRLAPEGWIRFRIVNATPSYSNDIMKLLPENSNLQTINFSGASVKTFYMAGPVRSGRFSIIRYNVTSQGEFQYYTDSIFVEPHDTVIYELEY